MMSTLRLSSLRLSRLVVLGGITGSAVLWASLVVSPAIGQSDIQIVPANPQSGSLPAPGTTRPSASELPTDASIETDASEPESAEMDTPEPLPTQAPLVEPAAEGSTTNYTDDLMSVDFPMAWEINVTEENVMISNVTTDEASLVVTQIARVGASPSAVVDANIDSFIEEGASVGRYRAVTIDGQDSLVIWLSDRPGVLSSAIATFIGYGDETILLFTRYAPANEAAEESILQLHTSFSNLESSAEE